jgi:3-dehydrosphinganine reductase
VNPTFWTGRHVVVTSGTSGIGLATTELLIAHGARVSVIALADDAAASLSARGTDRITVIPTDVRRSEQVYAALDSARPAFGPVRSLITCAGITKPGYFHELTDDDMQRQLDVNYFGTVLAVRAALPDPRAQRGSTITCMSSAAGLLGVFGYGAYCPSKFAVRGLTEVLHQEYKADGVTVTTVCPPDVDTPMLHGEQPLKPPELLALSSGEKPLTAEQVARALLDGTESGKASVTPGASTKLIAVAAGAAPSLVARDMDSLIAKARRKATVTT